MTQVNMAKEPTYEINNGVLKLFVHDNYKLMGFLANATFGFFL